MLTKREGQSIHSLPLLWEFTSLRDPKLTAYILGLDCNSSKQLLHNYYIGLEGGRRSTKGGRGILSW